jgi:endonuclease/exonuclease/phosphatase (EEP) superfamily protein YafD
MALTRLESGLCVANLHVSTSPPSAERELLEAAGHATAFAGSGPVILGGDFNVRPKASAIFDQLEERFGLAPRTAPDRLSHLLVRGLHVVEHPAALPPEARDVPDPGTGRLIRLADHNPVIGKFSSMG